jgi:hypothetical protein
LKNQNDLIVAGAVILVCIGVSLAFFFQKREPAAPPAPAAVVTKDAEPVPANVQYANSLPGGGAQSGQPGAQAGGPAPAGGAPQGVGGSGMTPMLMGASPTG